MQNLARHLLWPTKLCSTLCKKRKKKTPCWMQDREEHAAVDEVEEKADSEQRGEKKGEREGEMEDEQSDEDWGWI